MGSTEQRKLATITFADVVGYSALAQRDEALALALRPDQRPRLCEPSPTCATQNL